MTQFKWLYFGLFVILVLSVAIYLVIYFLGKPVEWTNKNSLIRIGSGLLGCPDKDSLFPEKGGDEAKSIKVLV